MPARLQQFSSPWCVPVKNGRQCPTGALHKARKAGLAQAEATSTSDTFHIFLSTLHRNGLFRQVFRPLDHYPS